MDIFISWSGTRSKTVANALKSWLEYLFPEVHTWMSDRDISPGTNWFEELSKKLESSAYGIICLTPENTSSPWLLFEAGALSKAVKSSRVVPFCFGLDPVQVQQPLAQFQSVKADKEGVLKMVRSINELLTNKLKDEALNISFDFWWLKLEEAFGKIPEVNAAPSLDYINVKRVYCAYTKEFEHLKPEGDIEILKKYFPDRVHVQPNVSKLQFQEDLTTGQYEILHLLGKVDPVQGDLFFNENGTEKLKLDGLRQLIEACKARLVFLATCDSTVLASRISRLATVIAAYGEVDSEAMIEWERTFYNILVKGRKLTEAFDIAQASSDVPMTIHLKQDIVIQLAK
ncbi:MAG: TIR domain-containing protein [Chitinophagaceae bacterium]|nr:TIR domain-containing protein [Chitinophagaceae bacterium]